MNSVPRPEPCFKAIWRIGRHETDQLFNNPKPEKSRNAKIVLSAMSFRRMIISFFCWCLKNKFTWGRKCFCYVFTTTIDLVLTRRRNNHMFGTHIFSYKYVKVVYAIAPTFIHIQFYNHFIGVKIFQKWMNFVSF